MKLAIVMLFLAGLMLPWQFSAADAVNALPQESAREIVEIVALHDHAADQHLFRISEHTLPSGWITLRFTNASPVDHFFLIRRYPEAGIAAAEAAGQSLLDHWKERVAGSFEGFDAYLAGEVTIEQYSEGLVERLQSGAPWFLDPGAPPMGGAGFIAPGATAVTTVRFEPGEYIVECYVRDENGIFHTAAGILDHLTVGETRTDAPEPVGNARVSISSTAGIQVEAPPVAGPQIIQIHFEDQTVYPQLLGHNIQLARLRDRNDEAVLEALAEWMDWRHPTGPVNRAPGGVRFIGGVREMTGGATAYLHVDLEPGDYAWIAEIPDPASHGMLHTFTVP